MRGSNSFSRFLVVFSFFAVTLIPSSAFASASSSVSGTGNLDASSSITSVPGGTPTFDQLETAASYNTSVDVRSSLGVSHTVQLYFFHTATGTWDVNAYADGAEIASGSAGSAVLLEFATLTFDGSGDRTSVPDSDFTITPTWSDGSVSASIAFLFSPLTQLGADSDITLTDITPADSVGGACGAVRSCVDYYEDSNRSSCISTNSGCNKSAEVFSVSANELAERAIQAEKCSTKNFQRRKTCFACYQKAKERLSLPGERTLFKGMLAQARTEIATQRNSHCPN